MEDHGGAGNQQREGQHVGDLAECEDEDVRQDLPYLAAVPAEVEDEAEEDSCADEAETDGVELRLFELVEAWPRDPERPDEASARFPTASGSSGHLRMGRRGGEETLRR